MTLEIITKKYWTNKGLVVNPNLFPSIFSYCMVCQSYNHFYQMSNRGSLNSSSIRTLCRECNSECKLLINE